MLLRVCPSIHSILSRGFKCFVLCQSFRLPHQLSQVGIRFLIRWLYSSFSPALVQSIQTQFTSTQNVRFIRVHASYKQCNVKVKFHIWSVLDLYQIQCSLVPAVTSAACAVHTIWICKSVSPGACSSGPCIWCSSAPLCWVFEFRSNFRVLSQSG